MKIKIIQSGKIAFDCRTQGSFIKDEILEAPKQISIAHAKILIEKGIAVQADKITLQPKSDEDTGLSDESTGDGNTELDDENADPKKPGIINKMINKISNKEVKQP